MVLNCSSSQLVRKRKSWCGYEVVTLITVQLQLVHWAEFQWIVHQFLLAGSMLAGDLIVVYKMRSSAYRLMVLLDRASISYCETNMNGFLLKWIVDYLTNRSYCTGGEAASYFPVPTSPLRFPSRLYARSPTVHNLH